MADIDRPAVLVFDVNETLLDIEALEPLFARFFGRPGMHREWFGQLVMYSMAVSLADCYTDFFTLGRSVVRMLADIHGVQLADEDVAALTDAMAAIPAHPDVAEGLSRLRDDGYRLAALTNSPTHADRPTALENAGLGDYFEHLFSVDELRVFKPATELYQHTAREMGARPEACMMVAAHVWDTIGAQAAGFRGALIARPGNVPLRADGIHQPDVIAGDLVDLARQLAQIFQK
ncbi:haloacid dehalogenase type II [Mycolicibacter kumamotonensis]|jgi:2-haloacid dehalogenase|uniref:Haloacid dehalogenase type II n=1 Tax=Mycolicibacter kumamotonensis TaxID=354243 RepID=A0A1X0E830_9MYCO|nr:haloacid dehalogenase type II [Mycolicibacter kumamotonensis]NDJ89685.1 haloacid dehalogenase type II [Mycolicibacter kumamotonensis]ORA80833.1 haloacid dehalogenase, type II [Mycolicibacter kumamotonensis]